LLPVADIEKIKRQVIESGNQTYGDRSYLPFELLFYDVKELAKHFTYKKTAGGGQIIVFKGAKKTFAEKIEKLNNQDHFKWFKLLFEMILKWV